MGGSWRMSGETAAVEAMGGSWGVSGRESNVTTIDSADRAAGSSWGGTVGAEDAVVAGAALAPGDWLVFEMATRSDEITDSARAASTEPSGAEGSAAGEAGGTGGCGVASGDRRRVSHQPTTPAPAIARSIHNQRGGRPALGGVGVAPPPAPGAVAIVFGLNPFVG